MKCVNPLVFKKNGKKVGVNGRIVDDLKLYGHLSNFRKLNVDKISFNNVKLQMQGYVLIPCGRCINCRLTYAKNWADRLTFFGEDYDNKFFITLTYDNVNILNNKITFILEDGTRCSGFSLVKSDLQNFFKRLRQYAKKNNLIEKEIKYYACGEYGEQNARPHYHIILYGLKLPDLVKEYSYKNYDYYQSEIISKLWNKGRIQVNCVSYEAISYVARYCTKKHLGKDAPDYYIRKGVLPEFSVCSNGIGKDFFNINKEKIYKKDSISIERDGRVYHIKPFRYFDKLFDIDNPERMKFVKLNRSNHYNSVLLHTDKYGIDYLQQLVVDNKFNKRKGV